MTTKRDYSRLCFMNAHEMVKLKARTDTIDDIHTRCDSYQIDGERAVSQAVAALRSMVAPVRNAMESGDVFGKQMHQWQEKKYAYVDQGLQQMWENCMTLNDHLQEFIGEQAKVQMFLDKVAPADKETTWMVPPMSGKRASLMEQMHGQMKLFAKMPLQDTYDAHAISLEIIGAELQALKKEHAAFCPHAADREDDREYDAIEQRGVACLQQLKSTTEHLAESIRKVPDLAHIYAAYEREVDNGRGGRS